MASSDLQTTSRRSRGRCLQMETGRGGSMALLHQAGARTHVSAQPAWFSPLCSGGFSWWQPFTAELGTEQVICCTNYFPGDAHFHFVFSGSKKGSLFGHHFSEGTPSYFSSSKAQVKVRMRKEETRRNTSTAWQAGTRQRVP